MLTEKTACPNSARSTVLYDTFCSIRVLRELFTDGNPT